MKQLNVKKLVLLNLPYILLGLFATNLGEAWRLAVGEDASAKMLSFFSTLPVALGSWWPSLHPLDLAVGLCCGAALRLAVYLKGKNAKKYRHNMEYGSARWGTHDDIAPYMDPVFQNNVILTQTERLTMSSRPKNPKYARNKNVLVIGGSGSGKTRFWLKPNLMQMHSSYVVTDPKGTILVECGKMLQRGAPKLGKDGKPVKDKHGKIVYEPYQIRVLNTINFNKSMHYNPFSYIHSEKDILKLVTTLIANTKGEGKAGDDFWVKAETLLYCALIGYIHYEAPVEEQNFSTLIEFINAMEVREDDEEFKNQVDLMFDELEARSPNHFAVRQYKKYKLAAGKTAKSILISCGARLAVFDIAELREITSYDELELDTLGDRRTALFLIMSDTDDSFNFLISMCYTQLFNLLCEKADDVYGGRLPVHVRCLIDECANIGQIPKLEKLVATIRSREISACLVLQAQSQLKAIYNDNADTIIGNMDSSIFLGGKEPTTLKELAAVLGKETIDTYNTGESRGRETSHSLNYQKLGKEDILMAMEELDLPQSRAAALLASPSPLADVYKEFSDRETSYMDVVRDSIEQRAEAALDAQRELPLYRHDAAHAREQGDLDLYRASRRANIACKEAIEASISEHYRDNRLDKDAVPQVIEQFGYTRTLYVLANTVQQKEWDERFSPANKAWARTVDIPPNPDGFGGERNLDFVVDSHSGLVDLFLSQARQDYLRLQPLTPEEIRAEAARLLQELRAPDTPNSPHGTHYMARVSPDFLARAGTQAHDQLITLLPFRSLAITGMKDLPGTYVTILASEDRSKELRQRRPSVRRQLKQEPRPAEKPEKKSPIHKKKEPER